jgi:Fe-S-cluster containining protein
MKKSELVQITRRDKITEDEFQPFVNAMYEQVWGNLFPPQILTHNLSNTVENNVITSEDTPIPDCMTCGACCASFVCVDVAPGNPISSKDCWEITREGETGEYTVDRYIKRKEKDFSCTALEGTIGENVSCNVYEDRPRMCRKFEAGSDRCHAVRRAYGLEPFLSLMEMFEAKKKLEKAEDEKVVNKERVDNVRIVEDGETENLQIYVLLKDGSEHLIHTFDRDVENWFKSEFDGLTLLKAKDLVAAKIEKGKN